jgi:hypothetical protein
VRSIRIILDAIYSTVHARTPSAEYGGDGDGDSVEEDSIHALETLRMLSERLAHIRTLEASLITKLVASEDEGEPTRLPVHRDQEVFVRPGTKWKGKLASRSSGNGKASVSSGDSSRPSSPHRLLSDDEVSSALHAARLDTLSLWHHTSTKEILRRKKIRLEESPGL